MNGLVLVLNSGSSSIKFQLVDPVAGTAVASGLVERIGEPDACVVFSSPTSDSSTAAPSSTTRMGCDWQISY